MNRTKSVFKIIILGDSR